MMRLHLKGPDLSGRLKPNIDVDDAGFSTIIPLGYDFLIIMKGWQLTKRGNDSFLANLGWKRIGNWFSEKTLLKQMGVKID